MKNFVRPYSVKAQGRPQAALPAQFRERDEPPTPGYVLSNLLLFLRRNLARLLLTGALMSLASFGAALLVFNKYSATATIVVDPRSARITQTGGVLANTGLDNTAIESLAVIAKSDGFLGALVDKLDLVHTPAFAGLGPGDIPTRAATIEKLGVRLNVARRGATYVLEATASSTSPEDSAKVANTAAQMIIDDQSGLRSGASEKTATTIEGRLAEVSARVNSAEEAAAALKAKLKVTGAGQGATLLERRVYELNQQQVLAAAKTGEARAHVDQLRKAGARAGQDLSQPNQNNVLSALRVEYVRLSRQSADQATVLGARHPEVVSLNAQLADLRRQIDAEVSRMVATARNDLKEAEQREAALARQLKDVQNESGELGSQLVKLSELEREAKAERAIYEQLLNRQKELTETKNLEPNDIRIVSMALAPTKTSPGKATLGLASGLLGLLSALGYALSREAGRGTLRTTRQAEHVSGLGVAGLVPELSPPAGALAGERLNIAPWLAELGASLETAEGRGGAVILVTSARRGEGRSTVAANLSAMLARAGENVLLVEADRSNDAHDMAAQDMAAHDLDAQNRDADDLDADAFDARDLVAQDFGAYDPQDAAAGHGLIDVLTRGVDLESAFAEREAEGYTVLPYGGATGTAAAGDAMTGGKLAAVLRQCRRWFDFVVIDGPPALEAAHVAALARQADQTIFVVEWDETSRANVSEALDRLDPRHSALVLNKVDSRRYRLFDPTQSYRLELQPESIGRAA